MHEPTTRSLILTPMALAITLMAFACSSNDRPPPAQPQDDLDLSDLEQYDRGSADVRDILASGGCTDGETQVCRIYLPSHNDIQPCFVGEQLCTDSTWGDCGNTVLVDANNDDAELDPADLSDS